MIYLNHNTTSYPKPASVIKALEAHLMAPPLCSKRSSAEAYSTIERCRQKVANFFGVEDSKRVVFTSGSTEALNLVLFGLKSPKHIISSVTEHNSVIRPLKYLEQDYGVRLSWVNCDTEGFISLEELEASICKDSSAIVLNHCSNVTGAIQDLNAISLIAKKHQVPLIIDASQSAGALPIDLSQYEIDAFVFTAHKSLYGISGFGGLILNPRLSIQPLKVGGTGTRSNYLFQPQGMPQHYEAGTENSTGAAALLAGIKYIEKEGIANILSIKHELTQFVWNKLKSHPQIDFFGGPPNEHKLPVLNLRVKDLDIDDFGYILEKSFSIITRTGLHCAPLIHNTLGTTKQGTLRLSFSSFNTLRDAQALINAIYSITAQLRELD